MTLCGDVDLKSLARATPGYVGADLTSLATTASTLAIRRCVEGLVRRDTLEPDSSMDTQLYADLPTSLRDKPMARFLVSHPNPLNEEQLSTLSVSSIDFTAALKIVQPSAKREGFATVPETTWADIGALSSVREELHMAIVRPASHPELFASMGMDSPSGVLLWGPPGCGKTLLAKAVANESRTNFISVKGPELLNKVSLTISSFTMLWSFHLFLCSTSHPRTSSYSHFPILSFPYPASPLLPIGLPKRRTRLTDSTLEKVRRRSDRYSRELELRHHA